MRLSISGAVRALRSGGPSARRGQRRRIPWRHAAHTPGVVASVAVAMVAAAGLVGSLYGPGAPASGPATAPVAAPGGVALEPRLAFHTVPNNDANLPDFDRGDLRAAHLAGTSALPTELAVSTTEKESQPAWSPDGRKLAFTTVPVTGTGFRPSSVVITDADGRSGRRTLVAGTGNSSRHSPAWSPDGRYIAYVDELVDIIDGVSLAAIVVVDVVTNTSVTVPCTADSTPRPLPPGASPRCYDTSPAWDPSGVLPGDAPKPMRLAFSRGEFFDADSFIFVLDVDPPAQPGAAPQLGTPFKVTETLDGQDFPRMDQAVAWSPDGSLLAYVSKFIDREGPVRFSELVTSAPTPGAARNVLVTNQIPRPTHLLIDDPAWKPDGSQIVFAAASGGPNRDLFSVAPGGGAPQRLAFSTPNHDFQPDFQPAVDLTATGVAQPATLLAGRSSRVTLTLKNGPFYAAPQATAKLTVPSGLRVGAVTPSAGSCDASLLCRFDTLAPNATVTVNLDVTGVSAGTQEIVAALDSNRFELDPADNTARVPVVVDTADLAVTVTAAPAATLVGLEPIVVTYTVRNTGTGSTGPARFTATLPSVLGIRQPVVVTDSTAATPPACEAPTAGCDLGPFPPGRVVTIQVTLSPDAAIVSEAVGQVVAVDSTGDAGNNTARVPIRVDTADISVTATAVRGQTLVGRQPIVVRFTVRNSGTGPSGPVRFTATLPAELPIRGPVVVTATGGPGASCPQPIAGCDLGPFAPERVVTIEITLSPNAAFAGEAAGEVAAARSTGSIEDNRGSVPIQVNTLDLGITATANPGQTLVGQEPLVVRYELRNAGSGTSGTVRFTASLPAALPVRSVVVSASSGPTPSCSVPIVDCNLGRFEPNRVVRIDVTLSPDAPFVGEAIGEFDESFGDGSSGTARVPLRVDTADISIAVTAVPQQTFVGGAPIVVRYTITNKGTGATGPVRFTATLPVVLPVRGVLVSATGGPIPVCQVPTAGCDLGPFSPERVVTIEVTLNPAAEFTGPVVGEVVAPRSTGDLNDNIAQALIRVGTADVSVAVTVAPNRAFLGGDPITVRYTVTNAAGVTIGPVRFTATLPAPLLPPVSVTVSVSPGGEAGPRVPPCPAPTAGCDLGELQPGQQVVIEVVLNPAAAVAGEAVGAVAVPFESPDRAANNTARAPLVVVAPTITITPDAGKSGYVPVITGTNFPPGSKVLLRWDRGITSSPQPVTADATGRFQVAMIVFHKDVRGLRTMVATHAANQPGAGQKFAPARDNYLVVPGSDQPEEWKYRR